jgi:hypothetical protein
MRARIALLCLIAPLSLVCGPALAESPAKKPAHPAPAPAAKPAATTTTTTKPGSAKPIGTFEDWTAATNDEAGQTVCYAFAYANTSAPPVPGRGRVVLTVTQREAARDAVALSAGFAYPPSSSVAVEVGASSFDFYTASRNAFSRDGHATVAALQKAGKVVAKSPSPKGATVTDTFSLKGFSAAYAAINKACPAKAG